jgi:hypothetical protein
MKKYRLVKRDRYMSKSVQEAIKNIYDKKQLKNHDDYMFKKDDVYKKFLQ